MQLPQEKRALLPSSLHKITEVTLIGSTWVTGSFLSQSLWPGEWTTMIGQTWVMCLSLQWGGSRGNHYDLLTSKDSLPQVKPKFCYQKHSEWMTGSQNSSWPWQLDSLFLRDADDSKKILLTAFSHQESHVQKFKGIERRGSLVPVREIELWVIEVKELRGKCGFLSFPWKYKSEMAPVLKKPLPANSWSHKPTR